ncbi:tryptophan-rich sensory protein [Lacinutrix neustonica]|uniref:tryptophan-rich sensory protein n=1 Tax=Lacinutrix neustonica TaxID=2980107 RepID=UPI0028BE1C0D|nr:tryptophan-rich sensory protein [Lacinutrix neustonica]
MVRCLGGLRTLFTPAGYAFSIWGGIYVMLLGFIVYQGRSLFVKVRDDGFIIKIGWWFVVSCVANSLWVFSWIYGYTGGSCFFIFLLLVSLLKIVWNNRMELWDAPISVIFFLWWPFVIYSGWVTVASIANVSAYLIKIGWDGYGIAPEVWTVIMIGIATGINLIITWKRNMREFALVGAWALIAIGVANKSVEDLIVYTAFGSAVVLLISTSIHGYINRNTNPFIKFSKWRKK